MLGRLTLGRLRKPTWYDAWQAGERALRTFIQAFVALYPLAMIYNNALGVAPIDIDLAKKAAIAAGMAAVSFVWRWLLPDVGRSKPALSADPAVDVVAHPHDDDVATDA